MFSPALPEALEGLAHLGVEKISVDMGGLTVLDVLLPVHEPGWHELEWVLDDSDNLVDLLRGELTGAEKGSEVSFEGIDVIKILILRMQDSGKRNGGRLRKYCHRKVALVGSRLRQGRRG